MSKEVFVVVNGDKWGVRVSGSERLYRGYTAVYEPEYPAGGN